MFTAHELPVSLSGALLEDELAVAGFAGAAVSVTAEGVLSVWVPDDSDEVAVAAVVAAHDAPPPAPPEPTPTERIAALEAEVAALKAGG